MHKNLKLGECQILKHAARKASRRKETCRYALDKDMGEATSPCSRASRLILTPSIEHVAAAERLRNALEKTTENSCNPRMNPKLIVTANRCSMLSLEKSSEKNRNARTNRSGSNTTFIGLGRRRDVRSTSASPPLQLVASWVFLRDQRRNRLSLCGRKQLSTPRETSGTESGNSLSASFRGSEQGTTPASCSLQRSRVPRIVSRYDSLCKFPASKQCVVSSGSQDAVSHQNGERQPATSRGRSNRCNGNPYTAVVEPVCGNRVSGYGTSSAAPGDCWTRVRCFGFRSPGQLAQTSMQSTTQTYDSGVDLLHNLWASGA